MKILGSFTRIFFAFMLMSAIFLCQNGTVEAGANINWQTTSVTLEPGKAIIKGYFYNDGNSGATVTQMAINGTIAQYNINANTSDIANPFVGAGSRVDQTFVIWDGNISYSDSNPQYNFNTNVSWN